MNVKTRSMDAYNTLCRLYGDGLAQDLMKVRGSTSPYVARLARAMMNSRVAVWAAHEYQRMPAMPHGYGRLMTACGGSREVAKMCQMAGLGRRLSRFEIERAVFVVCYLDDKKPQGQKGK